MGRRRYQHPDVHIRTDVKRPYWYCRVLVDVRGADGAIRRKQPRKFLGYCSDTAKRDAERERDKILEPINKRTSPIASDITLGEFVHCFWRPQHLELKGAGTRAKYEAHLGKHILPKWRDTKLSEISRPQVQLYFNTLKGKLSWNTRADILTVLSSIFTKAADMGAHEGRHPARKIELGRNEPARERVILSPGQTEDLLNLLPALVRILSGGCDVTGCRVSEVLGLQEKHIGMDGYAQIRQRWYRGDIDLPKNSASKRDVYLGHMAPVFQGLLTGNPERFIFDRGDGLPYDDRDLLKIVRKALKKLGLYKPGMGFHSFRAKAITEWQASGASSNEAARMAGQTKPIITMRYTVPQRQRVEELEHKRRAAS